MGDFRLLQAGDYVAGLLQSELLCHCMINHFTAEEKVAHFFYLTETCKYLIV